MIRSHRPYTTIITAMLASGMVAQSTFAQTIAPILSDGSAGSAATAPVRSKAAQRPQGAIDCSISPSRIIDVASPIDGVLAEVFVRPGQTVSSGDVIARIDTEVSEAELENSNVRAASTGSLRVAEARLSAAAVQYRTQKRAWQGRVVPKTDYERARGELRVAEQDVQREKEALVLAQADQKRMALIVSKGEITAPFDGVIGEKVLNPSEAISGRPIAQLIVIDPMRVEAFATVEQSVAIREGQELVLVSRLSNPIIEDLKLDYVSPVADASSRTIRVFYTFSSQQVSPGYRCYLATRKAAETFKAGVAKGLSQ